MAPPQFTVQTVDGLRIGKERGFFRARSAEGPALSSFRGFLEILPDFTRPPRAATQQAKMQGMI